MCFCPADGQMQDTMSVSPTEQEWGPVYRKYQEASGHLPFLGLGNSYGENQSTSFFKRCEIPTALG